MAPTPEFAAFLQGEIDPASFRHADHLRVAYEALARHPFLEAASAISAGLRAMTARAGNPGAYHETMTLAFLALIAERRAAGGFESYEAFVAASPDLMNKDVLSRWYGDKLRTPLARRTFVLPDPIR